MKATLESLGKDPGTGKWSVHIALRTDAGELVRKFEVPFDPAHPNVFRNKVTEGFNAMKAKYQELETLKVQIKQFLDTLD